MAVRAIVERALALRRWAMRHALEIEDWSRAVELGERIVIDAERILGPAHPDTLASRNSLAYAYESAGRIDAAITLF
ncbi:tetratricopeptide repeat protein, partial [Nocardia salmonicida]